MLKNSDFTGENNKHNQFFSLRYVSSIAFHNRLAELLHIASTAGRKRAAPLGAYKV